jgi:hypothetical protein
MVHPTHDGERMTSTPLCRPVLIAKIAVVLAVWLGTLSYVLALCFTEVRGLCTTWGCRPTFETLPLFHAFWLIAFLPPALFVASVGPPKLVQRLATAVLLLGIGVGVFDTIVWAGRMAERNIYVQPMEYAQRWGYRLATSVIDLPLLAIPVAAGVAWVIARLRASRLEHKSKRQS